jgi:hypothetical protein
MRKIFGVHIQTAVKLTMVPSPRMDKMPTITMLPV